MKRFGFSLLLLLSLLLPARAATLVWDANTETNLAGYNVYFQSPAGVEMKDVGLSTQCPLSGLTNGVSYTLWVTAYNTDGIESDPSDSVSFSPAPGIAPMVQIAWHSRPVVNGTNWTTSIGWIASPPEYAVTGYQVAVLQGTNTVWSGSTTETNINLTFPIFTPTFVTIRAINYLGASSAAVLPFQKPARPGKARLNLP